MLGCNRCFRSLTTHRVRGLTGLDDRQLTDPSVAILAHATGLGGGGGDYHHYNHGKAEELRWAEEAAADEEEHEGIERCG